MGRWDDGTILQLDVVVLHPWPVHANKEPEALAS